MRLALASLALLTACATATPNQQALYSVEISLTAAERAATVYAGLPACPQPSGALCSDPATVSKILAADTVAYNAVRDLRAGKTTAESVTALIAGLVALIPVKK